MEVNMEVKRSLASVALGVAALLSMPALAAQHVPAALKFERPIPGPSRLVACADSLWVHSAGADSLVRLSAQDGRELGRFSPYSRGPGERVALTALGCKGAELFYALERKAGGKKATQLFSRTDGSQAPTELPSPGTGTISGISCGRKSCYLLQGKDLFVSEAAGRWRRVALPALDQVPYARPGESENPFRNWQERFTIAQNAFIRAVPAPATEEPVLLDSGRSQVISLAKSGAYRWGAWGVWEGRFMRARGLAPIAGSSWAISDVGLKKVFFFSERGDYAGMLTLPKEKDAYEFQYPLDLAASGNLLYVADFRAHKVLAFEIPAKDGKLEATETETDLARTNLLRNPVAFDRYDEDRCLSCHDGTQVQSLFNFAGSGTHHPVQPRRKEGDIPVRCSSCHTPHHDSIEKMKPVGNSLCRECHREKTATSSNHIGLKQGGNPKVKTLRASLSGRSGKAFEITNCLQCHAMHQGEQELLRADSAKICFQCHGDAQKPVNHPYGEVASAKDPLSCLSCHQLHGGHKDQSFAKAVRGEATCLSCHRELRPQSPDSSAAVHLVKVKAKMKKLPPWRAEEQVCIECHNPHEKLAQRNDLCASCHTDRKQLHTQLIYVAGTSRAEGIRLKNEQITCLTCHSAHGRTPEPGALLTFCASCHDKDADLLRKEFHKRFSRSKK
ncbi:MAG: cytochrome c3 family protein [Oligoflexia bacterium]|nr:cytochrome c3 family protein [Oligoflexia bacterium]